MVAAGFTAERGTPGGAVAPAEDQDCGNGKAMAQTGKGTSLQEVQHLADGAVVAVVMVSGGGAGLAIRGRGGADPRFGRRECADPGRAQGIDERVVGVDIGVMVETGDGGLEQNRPQAEQDGESPHTRWPAHQPQ
jgi:hypothetical protein